MNRHINSAVILITLAGTCAVKGSHIVAKQEWKCIIKWNIFPVFRTIDFELQQRQYRFGIAVAAHRPLGIPIQRFWCCLKGQNVQFTTQHWFKLITCNDLQAFWIYSRFWNPIPVAVTFTISRNSVCTGEIDNAVFLFMLNFQLSSYESKAECASLKAEEY